MATEGSKLPEMRNDTVVNVAGLLKGLVGETRSYRLLIDRFDDLEGTLAREIEGDVRLTRLRDGVMAHVDASGLAPMECVRCLREYDQPFEVDFDQEYRQTVDLRTGVDLPVEESDDDQLSYISENHELDLREPLRQEILIALPMRPDCGPECPGPDLPETGESAEEAIDDRLAALASLLGDEQGENTERREG
jgi:uncharacterized protein